MNRNNRIQHDLTVEPMIGNKNVCGTAVVENFRHTMPNRKVITHKVYRSHEAARKVRKLYFHYPNILPNIGIETGRCDNKSRGGEVFLVNGCWDTSHKIPNIIAEMHNINAEELQILQKTCLFKHEREYIHSPKGSDSGIESDCTDGNLSWLLNYKIHELPPVPDSSCTENSNQTNFLPVELNQKDAFETIYQEVPRIIDTNDVPKEDGKASNQPYRYSGPKKPPFTYTELIEHALNEKGELTVSGIYRWISDHFPFYKQNDDKWKNSVRHNLSINPHFRKGGKAVHGAGHLWTIAQKDEKKAWQIKQRMQQFIDSTYKEIRRFEQDAFDRELQAATDSILTDAFNDIDETDGHESEDIKIEYINLMTGPNGLEDFLSPPVSKQEIVQECGLGSDFFITDINPNSIGLNVTESGQVQEEGIYEEINFEYYAINK